MSGKTNCMTPSKVSHRHEEQLAESRKIAEEAPKDKVASTGRTDTGQKPSTIKEETQRKM